MKSAALCIIVFSFGGLSDATAGPVVFTKKSGWVKQQSPGRLVLNTYLMTGRRSPNEVAGTARLKLARTSLLGRSKLLARATRNLLARRVAPPTLDEVTIAIPNAIYNGGRFAAADPVTLSPDETEQAPIGEALNSEGATKHTMEELVEFLQLPWMRADTVGHTEAYLLHKYPEQFTVARWGIYEAPAGEDARIVHHDLPRYREWTLAVLTEYDRRHGTHYADAK